MECSVEVSDQEVRIDLAFNFKCSTKVRLRSLCATPFKVQTSSPQKFMVNPPSGLIPPLSYTTFQIILKPQAQLPQAFPRSPCNLFLIKTAQFPSSPGPGHHPEPVASEVVEILERGEAVLMATRRGDSKHLESLFKTGATISYRTGDSKLPESLLTTGATISYHDKYGLTTLHAAAVKGHKDVLSMPIEFGLDLESQDNEGHSLLH